MRNDDGIDKRALNLLKKYDTLAALYETAPWPLREWDKAYLEEHRNSPEDFAYMKAHGLAFDSVDMAHDAALDRCFALREQIDQRSVTNAFLASLASRSIAYRAALPAIAIMHKMPRHRYVETPAGFCEICSARIFERRVDLTHLSQQRHFHGSLLGHRTPYELQFFLAQHLVLDPVAPTPEDFTVFNAILDRLDNADEKCKPVQMQKILRATTPFSATLDQSRALLEILGFCGILESERHKGYLTAYTNTGLAPAKSHSSDWAYPVDFWTGRDRVNRDALAFWFGGYPEIPLAHR